MKATPNDGSARRGAGRVNGPALRLADLAGRRLAVWGLGRDTTALLQLLRARGLQQTVVVFDDQPPPPTRQRQLEAALGPLRFAAPGTPPAAALADAEILLKAPGVPLHGEALQSVLRHCPQLRLASPSSLCLAEPGIAAATIGITGTKGKSTIASLLHHALRSLGANARLGGNIGTPLADLLGEATPTGTLWVVELSSYQIADLQVLPRIAVLSNLSPAHLPWHGDVAHYYEDKLRLLRPAPRRIVLLNAADPATRRLCAHWREAKHYQTASGTHARGGRLWHGTQSLGTPPPALGGRHNLLNACAALAVLEVLGYAPLRAWQAMADYPGLPHRQQRLGQRGGLHYVDDSAATVPEASIAALRHFRHLGSQPLTLLAGGQDCGLDYRPLARELGRRPTDAVVTMYENGGQLRAALAAMPGHNLRSAAAAELGAALALARALTPDGGLVLLSPGAPSRDAFGNYRERGRLFQALAGCERPVPGAGD